MVYIVVPKSAYERAIQALPRGAWAWAEVRIGRGYGVEADPWEDAKRRWEAESLLEALRAAKGKVKHD